MSDNICTDLLHCRSGFDPAAVMLRVRIPAFVSRSDAGARVCDCDKTRRDADAEAEVMSMFLLPRRLPFFLCADAAPPLAARDGAAAGQRRDQPRSGSERRRAETMRHSSCNGVYTHTHTLLSA